MSTNIKEQFESLPWHDANLLEILIDRQDPGHKDEVALKIEWPDGQIQTMCFRKCYAMESKMNFNVIALESILDANCFTESPLLDATRRKWATYGVDLSTLLCFEIEMNTTASIIRIVARSFDLS